MFCPNCGSKLPDVGNFCPVCGDPIALPVQNDDPMQQPYPDDYYPPDYYPPPPPDPYPPNQPQNYPPAAPQNAANGGGQKNGKTSFIILSVLIGLLLVVIVVLVIVFFVQRSGSKPANDGTGDTKRHSGVVDSTGKETRDVKLVSSDISNYPDVKVYFSVVDGNDVPAILTSPTANITERVSGGADIVRTVKMVERLENHQGVGMDILIDKSGSMSDDFPKMQQILSSFVNSLDYASGDKAELISFDSLVMYMCAFTNDAALLLNGISNMTPDGTTALYDALYVGINNAGSRSGANCVIAFTDGEDNESTHTYSEIIQLANSRNIPVYLIGTSEADEATLRSIADATGGSYWNADDISNVSEILEKIYVVQKGMYCVEYTSEATIGATAERTITCEICDDSIYGKIENATFTPHEVREVKPHSSRYEFIRADVTWNEANEQCLENGGHLVTITTQEEMNTVLGVAANSGVKYIWIGGYTSIRDNYIYGHWVTGEQFTYENWDVGEPSRYDRDGAPEAYMMLWFRKNYWSWNDQRNDVLNIPGITYFRGNMGYICEYEDQ